MDDGTTFIVWAIDPDTGEMLTKTVETRKLAIRSYNQMVWSQDYKEFGWTTVCPGEPIVY